MNQIQMIINGNSVNSVAGEWIDIENPSIKTVFAQVPRARKEDVDIAVKAAKAAFAKWSRTSAPDRGKILFAITDALEQKREELARLISMENGNALRTQSRGEVNIVIEVFRYVAGICREIKGTSMFLNVENLDYTRREPYGVVGAIVPWNAPLMLAALKIAPAVMTGNTVVLKTAEDAPLAVLEMGRICNEFLPPGVLNVITGYGLECGAPLAEHPDVPKVSFTGSTAVGRSILASASQRIAAVSLELGGKSPQIIFPDVDLDFTTDGVITAMRFSRQGQSCTAGSRVYVHESIADKFLEKLVGKLRKFQIGNALDEKTDAGSLVNLKQFNRVCSYVKEAMDAHPNALILGGLPSNTGPMSEGYFFEPTIFLNLPESTRMTHEEVFGPVLSVSTWSSESEVIKQANSSEYGLAAFVWSRAGAPALRMAHELQAGWVMVNQGGGQAIGHSYGGMKQSGAGREFSLEGILNSYTEVKQISVSLGTHGF